MSATFRAAATRLRDCLNSCRRFAPNGDEIGFPIVRNRDEFVDAFRDFWRALNRDLRLLAEVQRLTFEDLGCNGDSRLPTISSQRAEGWLFLRHATGDYSEAEAALWGEWFACESKRLYKLAMQTAESDRGNIDEVAQKFAIVANVPFVQPTLEQAVIQAYERGDSFTCQFKSMVVALNWLIAVDEELEASQTYEPTDEFVESLMESASIGIEERREEPQYFDWQGVTVTEAEFIFRPDGEGYYLKGFGESGHVSAKGAKGLNDLYRLVRTASIPVAMLELECGLATEMAQGDERSHQPVFDAEGWSQITSEMNQIRSDIANINSTDPGSDMERVELEEKLANLEENAMAMRGLKGKPRDLNSADVNRMKSNISGRIKTACEKIASLFPKLADHFRNATGSCDTHFYRYSPGIPDMVWNTSRKQ